MYVSKPYELVSIMADIALIDSEKETLSVKLVSASNQELEIAFVYNPNDELEKIRNLKAAVTHLASNGCLNQLTIGDYNSSMNRDLD